MLLKFWRMSEVNPTSAVRRRTGLDALHKGDDASQPLGCVLAHSMGLGKTLSCVATIAAVLAAPQAAVRRVCVVCPAGLVHNWQAEFVKWCAADDPDLVASVVALGAVGGRELRLRALERWRRVGGVAVIGYDLYQSTLSIRGPRRARTAADDEAAAVDAARARACLQDPGPDFLVLDEAHTLKNPESRRYTEIAKVRTRRRVALTGTPLQNNLLNGYFHVARTGHEPDQSTEFPEPGPPSRQVPEL